MSSARRTRYTSGMTRPSRPQTQGRLLAVCLLSLALHALVLAMLARRGDAPAARAGAGLPIITLRLAGTRIAAAPQPAAPAPADSANAPATARAAVAGDRSAARARSPAPQAIAADLATDPASGSIGATVPANGIAVEALDDDSNGAPPGIYRMRVPPSATLDYALSRAAPGQPAQAAGVASLAWQTDDNHYSMRLDGVPELLAGTPSRHSVASEGGYDDVGIAPLRTTEQRGDDSTVTTFDQRRGVIAFGAGKREAQLLQGGQDRASLLIQLAGMGMENPLQLRAPVVLQVGAAGKAGLMRFEPAGDEQVQTATGPIDALHLVQQERPGQARLELWLAPALNWLPVQLRDTWPDGSVATRLLTRAQQAPAR